MTTTVITGSSAILGATGFNSANGGDGLIVTDSGYIVSNGGGVAAELTGGNCVVTVNGIIEGNTTALSVGKWVSQAPDEHGHNRVSVGVSGSLVGGFYGPGLVAYGGANTIDNKGSISGSNGVVVSGADNVVLNSGTISGGVGILGIFDDQPSPTSGGVVSNSGVVSGVYAMQLWGGYSANNSNVVTGSLCGIELNGPDSAIVNSGTISATAGQAIHVSFDGDGVISVKNSGTITTATSGAAISDLSASCQVLNSGLIDGGGATVIALGGGSDFLLNVAGGVVRGGVDMGGDSSADTVTNAGTIFGDISMGAGIDSLENVVNGVIYGDIDLGSNNNADSLLNLGKIYGNVFTGGGNDTVDNTRGFISGTVSLGSGDDSFDGGAEIDRVAGGDGNDSIDLGSGSDHFIVQASLSDGDDVIEGFDGVDTYNAARSTRAVEIDLGTGVAQGVQIGLDLIFDFENAIGGSRNDSLTGTDAANRFDGRAGNDRLNGEDGNDRLIGNTGNDIITGGAGRDVMTGGSLSDSIDTDRFVFRSIIDSGAKAAARDVITDFTDHGSTVAPLSTGADLIDLSAIDANTGVAGNQAFTFNPAVGAAFSGSAGSLVWKQFSGSAVVFGDVDGDGIAEFAIQLNGQHMLSASDFVL